MIKRIHLILHVNDDELGSAIKAAEFAIGHPADQWANDNWLVVCIGDHSGPTFFVYRRLNRTYTSSAYTVWSQQVKQ